MAEPATKRATYLELYEQIEKLAPNLTGEILEPGVLRTMSRPGKRHRRAHAALLAALGAKNAGTGGVGWWIELEAEIRLLEQYLSVPDLAGWRVERVPDLPDENPITIAPDWACEILSPTTERDDRRLKLPLYARAGVHHTWLVDPEQQLVEVFESIGDRPTLIASAAESELASLPPFLDLPIPLASLWLPT